MTLGSGEPVHVLLHGAGASPDETALLARGLPGTRVMPHLRGHGATVVHDGRFGWDALAGDLRAVVDAVGATRALGVSVGAGALARLLADAPDLLDAAVFFAPAVLDRVPADRLQDARTRVAELADAVDAADVDALSELLARDVPPAVRTRPEVVDAIQARATSLAGSQVGDALRALVGTAPLASAAELARVRTRSTVVGQHGDPLHTVAAAREYADALPGARLVLFDEDRPLWDDAERLDTVLREALA